MRKWAQLFGKPQSRQEVMGIPGGLTLDANGQGKGGRFHWWVIPKGQGRLQKVFSDIMSLRSGREWNQVNKFGRYGCICHRTWVITLRENPLKIKSDARRMLSWKREKQKQKQGPWCWWECWGRTLKLGQLGHHTWRCLRRGKGKSKVCERRWQVSLQTGPDS